MALLIGGSARRNVGADWPVSFASDSMSVPSGE